MTALTFDRGADSLAIADESGSVSIWDVNRVQKVRVLTNIHSRKVNSISWAHSLVCPYLLTSGGSDGKILNHDLRIKDSIVNEIEQH